MPNLIINDALNTRNLSVSELLAITSGPVEVDEIAAPGTPATGKVRLYAKSDGRLYLKDDAGSEVQLDPSGLAVLKSLFDAFSVLVANVNDTPLALALAAGEVVGRLRSGGNVVSITAAGLLDIMASVMPWSIAPSSWYDGCPPFGNSDLIGTGTALSAARLYANPFWSPKATTWDKIGINCMGASAGAGIKMGVFDADQYGRPNVRLFNGSEQSLTAIGSKEETITLAVPAGKFFIGGICSDAIATFQFVDRDKIRPLEAADTATAAGTQYYSDAYTYASGIPATFGAVTVNTGNNVPRFMLKSSATP